MKKLLLTLSLSAFAATASAATPLWLRDVKISPDGKEIAFTYKGDIYKVPVSGGDAVRLTSQPSYDATPIWSPDGKSIAFSSTRNGSMDVYIMPSTGGTARRLTRYSTSEIPTAFTPDGKFVLFSAAIQDNPQSALFPSARMTEVYKVPVEGGRIEQVISTPAEMISFSPDGKFFLYQDNKGMEDEWRKHHTSSVTRDVWSYDMASGKHHNLTAHAGEDRNPVISVDGKNFYFLSERQGGTMNVYSAPIDSPSKLTKVTDFSTHPVRFLSQGADGTLAFAYDGEIYTKKSASAKPEKVKINITLDEDEPVVKRSVNGSAQAVVSPDGKQVAIENRGDVFVTSVEYRTTKQVSSTPEAEGDIAWAPDNRSLVYTSERDGHFNIYRASIGRKDDLNFPNATVIKEEPLFDAADGIDRTCPKFSPDGKELAFIYNRHALAVMDLDTKKVRMLTDSTAIPESDGSAYYSWSPDGKWIVLEFTGNGHEPYSDVAVVNTTGKPEIHNLTLSSYFDVQPKWVMDGNAIAFASDRYGMRSHASWGSQMDVMLVFLNQDAYDKYSLSKEDYELRKELEKQQKADKEKAEKKADKKDSKSKKKSSASDKDEDSEGTKDIVIDFDNIQDRIVRVTPASSDISDFAVTKDGENLYYLSAFQDRYDLWKTNLRKHETAMVSKMNTSGRRMQFDKSGDNLFLLSEDGMSRMPVSSESIKPITYSAVAKLDTKAERDYLYNYVKQEVKNRFYETTYHGCDWEGMTEAYAKFLPHINNNYDFQEMLSELLGELNASHTGARYYAPNRGETTASLGLLYDWSHYGPGLKVAEVLEGGPFDHANTIIKKGSIVEKINGVEITDSTDFTALLADIAGKKTLVTIFNGGNSVDEVVLPITSGQMNNLLYERWVKQRAADVEKLSGGRLGYVHLRSMDDENFRNIYIDLLSKYVDKEGIVIDTRWNGGGRLHEDIEVLFSGDKYLTQVIRGQDICDMPSRRWNKPSIMLQCEANYSNAHGTPWVYNHKKMGKLVGMPVPGTMSSVNWITTQDPTLIFGVPVIGYRTAEGNYLENTQLEPDIKIANDPAVIVTGEDQQLRKAVEVLLSDIDSANKK